MMKPLDRGEAVTLMEPTLIPAGSRHRPELTDLALKLVSRTAGFRSGLPAGLRDALPDLVRAMNCYYSNLIEGHNTHPTDIERALNNDYSTDADKRNLQLEAKAHIAIQKRIDEGEFNGQAATVAGVGEIHRGFCEQLPAALLWVENPDTGDKIKVEAGVLRGQDVRVGNHFAVSPGAVPRFLARFAEVYAKLNKTESILAAAAMHHRLLWIHPFADGNGRVARLMSHAVLAETLETGGLWSVARGLARNAVAYKSHLAACDSPRRNDLDGRGHLSEEALAGFTRFFLEVCLDQVKFMEELMQPDRLKARILIWAEEEIRLGNLPKKARLVLKAVLHYGELARNDAADLLGVKDPRHIVSSLSKLGVLSPKAPYKLALPAAYASRWMPGLFPE